MDDVKYTEHFDDDQLLWLYYGEATNSAEIELHLAGCRDCRKRHEELKAALATIGSWQTPERDAEYGQRLWRRLVQKDASIAARSRRTRWRALFEPRRLAAYALSAVLVIAAFVAGRLAERTEAPRSTAAAARDYLLAAALTEHIEQSERTLIELTNAASTSDVDLPRQQQRAEALLAGNRLYRQAAAGGGHAMLANVLEDLERVLTEVAHVSDELTPSELQQLRSRVDEQQLLFRLRVLGARLREVQDRPLRRSEDGNRKG